MRNGVPFLGAALALEIASQGKSCEVGKSEPAAIAVDFAMRRIASDHLRDLHVDQVWRVERLMGGEQAFFHGFRGRRTEESFEQSGSVNDDHARSRSARTASAGGVEGTVSVRLCRRDRNSSIVGRSAT